MILLAVTYLVLATEGIDQVLRMITFKHGDGLRTFVFHVDTEDHLHRIGAILRQLAFSGIEIHLFIEL